jgi:hypothetical protein
LPNQRLDIAVPETRVAQLGRWAAIHIRGKEKEQ